MSEPEKYSVEWSQLTNRAEPFETRSSLNYSVYTTGIKLEVSEAGRSPECPKVVRIRAYNSKGNITPGYITVPMHHIPDIVEQLNNIYRDNPV